MHIPYTTCIEASAKIFSNENKEWNPPQKNKQGRNSTFTPCPTSCAILPNRPCGTCYVLSVNDAIVKVCFAFDTILYANHPQKEYI